MNGILEGQLVGCKRRRGGEGGGVRWFGGLAKWSKCRKRIEDGQGGGARGVVVVVESGRYSCEGHCRTIKTNTSR